MVTEFNKMDKVKMENEVREALRQDGREILTSEGYKIVIPSGECSDHASKASGDCCRGSNTLNNQRG